MKKLAIAAAILLSTVLVSTAADSAMPYKGNPDSKIYHQASCRHFTNSNCTATFSTRDAATAAGYIPCKICKP